MKIKPTQIYGVGDVRRIHIPEGSYASVYGSGGRPYLRFLVLQGSGEELRPYNIGYLLRKGRPMQGSSFPLVKKGPRFYGHVDVSVSEYKRSDKQVWISKSGRGERSRSMPLTAKVSSFQVGTSNRGYTKIILDRGFWDGIREDWKVLAPGAHPSAAHSIRTLTGRETVFYAPIAADQLHRERNWKILPLARR